MSWHPYYTDRHGKKCVDMPESPVMRQLREAAEKHLSGDGDLLAELRALRADIAELKDALRPVPGLIVTGQQALDEFKRLTGEAK